MSRTGNYTSYGRNVTLLDTDSISVNLISRQVNAINSLAVVGDIIALTAASEWRIGSTNEVLTPTTVTAKPQGWRGSHGQIPVLVGNEIVYVQANGKVIRNLGYDFQSDSFVGDDIRVLSEHLFDGHEIVDIAYQQDNDSIVWCVRDDGILLALTYMKEQEVIGWSWHETDGLVESVCVIPSDGYDELWLVVNRDGDRLIEYMTQRTYTENPLQQFFVDSGLTDQSEIDITGITNAAEAVVTTDGAHGFSNGDRITIEDVVGMEELNDNVYYVRNKTSTEFSLSEGADDPDDLKFLLHCDGVEYSTNHSSATGQTVTSVASTAYTKLAIRFDGVAGAKAYTAETGQTVTFVADAQLDTAQKKFGLSSLLLDGTGDYVTIPNSSDFNFGSGDFTIEAWVRFSDISADNCIMSLYDTSGGANNRAFYFRKVGGSSSTNFVYSTDGITTTTLILAGWTPNVNTWYHVALVRSSTKIILFIDGIKIDEEIIGTDSLYNSTALLRIGVIETTNYFNGWIDEVRISKGIARWTENFTLMTVQYPDYTDLPYNDTNVKKFGTASIKLLGNSYLTVPDSDDWNFGSGDFTIDFWVYLNDISSGKFYVHSTGTNIFQIYIPSSGKIQVYAESTGGSIQGNFVTTASVLTASQWQHIAIMRSGSNCYIAVGGILAEVTTTTIWGTIPDVASAFYIGADTVPSNFLNGYIDEFRITKGRARWTADFTPPTSAGTLEYVDSTAYGTYLSGGSVSSGFTGYITGLNHLEGKEVALLADGIVLDRETVSGGSVNLASAALVTHVGLSYESDLETLNIELGSVKDTMQGRKIKISGVTFRLLNTRGGWIGPDSTKLYEALSAERLGLSGIDLYSGDYKPVLGAGYEDGGRVFYRQVDPLPVTITAIIPNVNIGG
jgi:hypothetical protein